MSDSPDKRDDRAPVSSSVAAAMNRVLTAEREALAELEACRSEADRTLEAARREARAILERAERIARDIHSRTERLASARARRLDSDQALGGHAQIVDPVTAPVAPTTGIGDIWSINTAAQESQTAYQGSAAVDSDAANRLQSVQVTFSVSNAAVQLVVEGATVELL